MSQDTIEIPIEQIKVNETLSPHRYDDVSIRELSSTIKRDGLLNPISVIKEGDGKYRVVCGRRRYLACKEARLKKIRATVISSKESAESFTIIENIQKQYLLPIEVAEAYAELLETRNISQSILAERIGKSQSYVAQKLRLLKLPFSVHVLMRQGSFSEGQARQLLRLNDIIGNLVTTEFKSSNHRISEQDRFKSWTEYYQDYYAWEYFTQTVQVLSERIDRFYFDLVIAASDCVLDEVQTILKDRFKPKVKRDEDIKFLEYYISKYCTEEEIFSCNEWLSAHVKIGELNEEVKGGTSNGR